MDIPASSVTLSFASPDGLVARGLSLDDLLDAGTPFDDNDVDYDLETVVVTLPSGEQRCVEPDRVTTTFTHPYDDAEEDVTATISDLVDSGEPVGDAGETYDMRETLDVDLAGSVVV